MRLLDSLPLLLLLTVHVLDAQHGILNAHKIADGVRFLRGDASKGYSNNIVIEMKDCLIVVDANYPGRTRELVAQIGQLSPRPVAGLLGTLFQ